MPSEVKTGRIKFEAKTSQSLKSKFQRHCKKLNVSMGQRIRDLVQADMKRK